MNRRSMVAALGAACLTPVIRSVGAQELTNTQQETFAGAVGLVFRRLDVEVSGRPYAYEDMEQHALFDWFAVVYPDEATATETFEAWTDEFSGFEPEPASWLFPKLDYDDTRMYQLVGPRVLDRGRYVHGAWHLTAGENRGITGHIVIAQRGLVVVAGLVHPREDSEDVHIPVTSALLGEVYPDHVLLDTPLPAPGEVIDEARLLTLAPPPELIADEEDIDGCTEVETWTWIF